MATTIAGYLLVDIVLENGFLRKPRLQLVYCTI